jgi:hypothetical protein
MHVYISDPSLLRNLEELLRRTGFVTEQSRSHELEVFVPSAPSEAQARRELNVCLATWQALNRGVETYIVESDGGSQGTREAKQRTRHFGQ